MSGSRYSTVVLVALLVIHIAVADKKHKGKCEMCQSFVDSFKAVSERERQRRIVEISLDSNQ